MVVLYAESYQAALNTLEPDLQAKIKKAVNNDTYNPPEVKAFCRRVCENAERIAEKPIKLPERKALADVSK